MEDIVWTRTLFPGAKRIMKIPELLTSLGDGGGAHGHNTVL